MLTSCFWSGIIGINKSKGDKTMKKSKLDYARFYICEYFGLNSVTDLETVRYKLEEYQGDYDSAEEIISGNLEKTELPNASSYSLVVAMPELVRYVTDISIEKNNLVISRNTVIKALDELLNTKSTVLKKVREEDVPFEVFDIESATNTYYIYLKVSEEKKVITETKNYKNAIDSLEVSLSKFRELIDLSYNDEAEPLNSRQFDFINMTINTLNDTINRGKFLKNQNNLDY